MSDNMKYWNALKTPPPEALKPIQGGRLKGKTDISPQWRYQAMTELFGPIGLGWKYEVVELWSESGSADQVMCFAKVNVYYAIRQDPDFIREFGVVWSAPIPGTGGSLLIEKESKGLHTSDEGYKMAITDALSVAMKMLGVGADVYMGMADGKHSKPSTKPSTSKKSDINKVEPDEAKEKHELIVKITTLCMELADGDEDQAAGCLEEVTTYDYKKDGETKTVQGTRESNKLKDFTVKRLRATYGSAKKAKEALDAAKGEADGPNI